MAIKRRPSFNPKSFLAKMEETAARHSLGSQPRLSLDHLRNLRLEIDELLNFLQPDSNTEEAVNEAEV